MRAFSQLQCTAYLDYRRQASIAAVPPHQREKKVSATNTTPTLISLPDDIGTPP